MIKKRDLSILRKNSDLNTFRNCPELERIKNFGKKNEPGGFLRGWSGSMGQQLKELPLPKVSEKGLGGQPGIFGNTYVRSVERKAS